MVWVALIGPEIEENLSLRYLASSLEAAGIASEIIPFNGEEQFAEVLDAVLENDEPPVLVGLSLAFQWRAHDVLALAVALKEHGYAGHITAGGHFATFEADPLLRDFLELDSICKQESEQTLVSLVHALTHRTDLAAIPGLGLRDAHGTVIDTGHPALPDLTALPRPDRRGAPARCFDHAIAPLVGSRGCYANCTFCCIAAWHEQSLPGKRYRVREPDDVAREMVEMQRERGVDIFVFHDDNFFLPGHKRNLERFNALADALQARGMGPFATVVKARPTDVDPDVFEVLARRLHCIRVYIGIETDADQGLKTLRRWAHSKQNHTSIRIVRELGLYTCFNMLVFDPDTTVESLETNIAFVREAAEHPFNFGRVELYAGTPLLARMKDEKRCWGDYLQWDYSLSSPEMERIFMLTMDAFHPRNFGDGALANSMMATRFDIEVCRHFHPDLFRAAWLDEGRALSRMLAHDTADRLTAIIAHVRANPTDRDATFTAKLSAEMRAVEAVVRDGTHALARTMQDTLGRGAPLTDLGDKVATSLQDTRPRVSGLAL